MSVSFCTCCRLSGGDLFEKLVTSDHVLTEEDCISYMRQVCQGVAHMHANNILHLDLKVSLTDCGLQCCSCLTWLTRKITLDMTSSQHMYEKIVHISVKQSAPLKIRDTGTSDGT